MLSRRWTNSHRCCWITVYVSCYNAQMNLTLDTMTCTCIIMQFFILSIASCNLFTQHISYLLWRDTTSELWTSVHCFTSDNTIYFKYCSFILSANKHHFPHYTSNLCFQQASEIDNLTVKLGQSILIVLCAGSTLATESLVLHHAKFRHQQP